MDPHQQRPAEWYRSGDVEVGKAAVGLYRVTDDGQPEVKLHGSWSDGPSMFGDDRDLQRLYGNVFGLLVTAVGGRLGKSTRGMSSLQDTTILPRYAVEGLWLDADDLALTEVRVQFWDQEEWSVSDAFPDMTAEQPDRQTLRVEYQPPEGRTAEVSEGSLSIVDASGYRQTIHPNGWVMESASAFSMLFKEPVSIDDVFSRWLVPLEFLIMTATGRPTGIRKLGGTNDQWKIESVGRPSSERWVDFRVSHAPRPSEHTNRHELLHLLSDFDFGRQVPLVLDVVSRHRYSVEHFGALKGRGAGGHLAQFVAAAQLVESFDRSLHDEQGKRSLEARLRRLSGETGGVLDEIIGHKRWAKHVARVRDIVVHGLETSEQLTRDVRSIQVATEILLLLFEARLLVAFGFDAAVAKTLIERRHRHWEIKDRITENYGHLEEISQRVE